MALFGIKKELELVTLVANEYNLDEVFRSLELSLRIGKEFASCWWLSVADRLGSSSIVWDMLLVFCVSDIGPDNIKVLETILSLRESWNSHIHKKNYHFKDSYLSVTCQEKLLEAALCLALSPKSMKIHHLAEWAVKNYNGRVDMNEQEFTEDFFFETMIWESDRNMSPPQVTYAIYALKEYITKGDLTKALHYGVALYLWKRPWNQSPCEFDVQTVDTQDMAWETLLFICSPNRKQYIQMCRDAHHFIKNILFFVMAIVVSCETQLKEQNPPMIEKQRIAFFSTKTYYNREKYTGNLDNNINEIDQYTTKQFNIDPFFGMAVKSDISTQHLYGISKPLDEVIHSFRMKHPLSPKMAHKRKLKEEVDDSNSLLDRVLILF